MHARRILLFAAICAIIVMIVACASRDPFQDTANAELALLIPSPPDTGYLVGDSVEIGADLYLAHLGDSVNFMLGDLWDTTVVLGGLTSIQDTIWVHVPLLQAGIDTIDVTMYLEDGAQRHKHAHITVRGLEIEFITNLPGQAGGRAGESCTLFVEVSGTGPFAYAWYKDGAVMQAKTSDTLIFASLQPGDSAAYFCVVQDAAGKKDTSRAAIVFVKPIDTPDPPSTVILAAETDYTFTLVWTGVSGVDGYKVYKDSIEYGIGMAAMQTTDTACTLQHDSRFWYAWVTSVKGALESMPSQAKFWEPRANKLYPPENLKVARLDSMRVALSWNSVAVASGYLISHNANRTTGTYTHTGFTADTFYIHQTPYRYYYYVKALNAADTSAASDTIQTATGPVP